MDKMTRGAFIGAKADILAGPYGWCTYDTFVQTLDEGIEFSARDFNDFMREQAAQVRIPGHREVFYVFNPDVTPRDIMNTLREYE